jgi:glycosyltransferase involved in cell wall biosynthesis
MKKIFFWSPYNTNIGTINSVLNSIQSIKKFSKNKYEPYLINSIGEWSNYKDQCKLINFESNFFNLFKMPSNGKILSRIFYILIFITNFSSLKKLIETSRPSFFIAHLITSLPLVLFIFFNFDTKLILRISGEPDLNIFRKTLWKLASHKIFCITCPSKETVDYLKKNNIFPSTKIKLLLDPVIDIKQIINNNKKPINIEHKNFKFMLSIGRLTKQKNFEFLIRVFSKINKNYPDLKLIILGEGELLFNLTNKINELNLNSTVFLAGFKKNIFNYLNKAECLVLPSIYENPGHVLIEAAASNCPIISSNCPTGPANFLDYGMGGYIFDVNDAKDLSEKIELFLNDSNKNIQLKKIIAKKKSINYTKYRHYLQLDKILLNK